MSGKGVEAKSGSNIERVTHTHVLSDASKINKNKAEINGCVLEKSHGSDNQTMECEQC